MTMKAYTRWTYLRAGLSEVIWSPKIMPEEAYTGGTVPDVSLHEGSLHARGITSEHERE